MQIIRLKEVQVRTGLGRSTLYKLLSEGSFPQSITLGARAVGWLSSEVDGWIQSKVEARNSASLSSVVSESACPARPRL
mgnify:CR=1 FL=1